MGWVAAAFGITKNKNGMFSLWRVLGEREELMIQGSLGDMDSVISPISHRYLTFLAAGQNISDTWGPEWLKVRLHKVDEDSLKWERTQYLDAWTSLVHTSEENLTIMLQSLLLMWQQVRANETGQHTNWGAPVIL